MSKKIVYESQVVDNLTGEVLKTVKEFKIKQNSERFCMVNMEFSWLSKFDNGTQFKVFFLLFEYENVKNNYVFVNETLKREIAKEINLSVNSITLTLKQLVENDCLIRVERGVYQFNPDIIYQGGTATVNSKRLIYEGNKNGTH